MAGHARPERRAPSIAPNLKAPYNSNEQSAIKSISPGMLATFKCGLSYVGVLEVHPLEPKWLRIVIVVVIVIAAVIVIVMVIE